MSQTARELSPAGKKIFLAVFCLIFVAIGLGLWIPNSLIPILEWSARRKWKEVPCVVVRSPAGQGEDAFGVEIAYRYEYDGRTLESSNPGSVGLFSTGAQLLWKLKPGDAAVCYVNPRPPYDAVLARDLDGEVFIWCFPLLFVVLPLWGLILGLVRIGRPPPEPEAVASPRPGSLVLGAPQRRGCGVISQLFILLILLGIGAILVLVPGFKDDWLIRGFYLVPLGFGSVVLVRSLGYRFLRSFNPQITLTLTPGQASPGGTIDVRWDARGATDRAKSFRITLEGREERQDRAGKGTRTLTETFATIDVAKGGPKDLKRGSAKVTVPEATMHSLVHGSRSIVWAFRIFAEIPLWPDGGEEYRYEIVASKKEAR